MSENHFLHLYEKFSAHSSLQAQTIMDPSAILSSSAINSSSSSDDSWVSKMFAYLIFPSDGSIITICNPLE